MQQQFIFLGNTSFTGFPQREHAFAIGLADRGYDVTFIEGMPSIGSELKDILYGKWKKNISLNLPKSLQVVTPPIIPTMFRSSYTPSIDRMIFHSWMERHFAEYKWNHTIAITTFPYWWYGFVDRTAFPFKKLIYDSCDSLLVPSRTSWALKRMKIAEAQLLREADAVTYSAHAMQETYSQYNSHCITNAVTKKYYTQDTTVKKTTTNSISIGYIGSIDKRRIDIDLILRIAEKFNSGTVHIYGPVNNDFKKIFQKFTNIVVHGFIPHDKIPIILGKIDVAIIPFLRNEITDLVNPLKLYEYSSAGVPIVAIRTMELDNYNNILYLADTKEQFILQIQKAVVENDEDKIQQRISFALENTWDKKIDQLLRLIQSL